jgi:hypothetical protein
MQSLHVHGGTNQKQRPSIEQTLSRDAVGGYIDQKCSIIVQNTNVYYLTITGSQDFNMESAETGTHYHKSFKIHFNIIMPCLDYPLVNDITKCTGDSCGEYLAKCMFKAFRKLQVRNMSGYRRPQLKFQR